MDVRVVCLAYWMCVCVCVHACMGVCVIDVCVCMCGYACMCVWVTDYVNVCMRVWVHASMHVLCIPAAWVWVCMNVCWCDCICM